MPTFRLADLGVYGKYPTHVDRFGARVARELAVEAVTRASRWRS